MNIFSEVREERPRLKKTDRAIIFVLTLILFVNIIKPFLDYFLNVTQATVTATQYVILMLLYIFGFFKIKKISLLELFFVVYITARFLLEIMYFGTSLMQPLVSLLKLLIFVIGCNYFVNANLSSYARAKISKLLWIYFFITIVFSILQQTDTTIGYIISNFGGNLTSQNGLLIQRSTGGIGGTVIDYTFVVVLFLIMFMFESNSYFVRHVKLFLLFAAFYLCFSRIVFLVAIITYLFGHIFHFGGMSKRSVFNFLAVLLFVFLFTSVVYVEWDLLADLLMISTNTSDESRTNGWYGIVHSINLENILYGVSMGVNTGQPLITETKITGDGQIFAMLYDYGLMGLLLYLGIIFQYSYQFTRRWVEVVYLIFVFAIVIFVNSGIDKYFVIYILPFVFVVLRGTSKYMVIQPVNPGFIARELGPSRQNSYHPDRI